MPDSTRECQMGEGVGWASTLRPGAGSPRILCVIPARMGSSRFPGKPLQDIGGQPMIWHVYQRCLEAGLPQERVYVATEDDAIVDACKASGLQWYKTGEYRTGTDRVAAVARDVPADVYVNVQGDEPFVSPLAIRQVTEAVMAGAEVANGFARITDVADPVDPNVPKVVLGPENRAVYLSRAPVPYPKVRSHAFCVQVCVYAFRPKALQWFSATPISPAEEAEGIELLRWIQYGHRVQMVEVPISPVAVDTPADLERARAYYEQSAQNVLTSVGQDLTGPYMAGSLR